MGDAICNYFAIDTFLVLMSFWILVNIIWIVFLFLSQSYQIAINMTTNEMQNYHRFSYLIHPADRSSPSYRRRKLNPFDLGPIGNCYDFWTAKGGLKDISWYAIFISSHSRHLFFLLTWCLLLGLRSQIFQNDLINLKQ